MSQSILQDVKQKIDLLTWNERLDLIAYIAQKGTSDRSFFAEEKAIYEKEKGENNCNP